MRRTFFIAALAAVLLPAGHAAADESVYAPYHACMAQCQTDESMCIDHIAPDARDAEALKADCIGAKAACIQECQFLPLPPEGGAAQPTEGGQQGQEAQEEEPVQREEPVQYQEPVQNQEETPRDDQVPHEEPPREDQPAQSDATQQGGAPQGGEEAETLNGNIKIYKFE